MPANPAAAWRARGLAYRVLAGRTTPALVISALVVVTVTVGWVLCMPRAVLMGDDLRLVTVLHHVRWPAALVDALTNHRNKYRPILELLIRVTVPVFRANMYAYVALNTVVEIGCALTVSSIANRLTRGNLALATLAACAFVVSRFAYYNLIQIYGIMEGLSLFFILLAVRSVVIGYHDDRPSALRATVWFGALAVLTDERYLAAAPFLVLAPLLHPARRLHLRQSISLALANCVPPAAYVFTKLVLFRTSIAMGTAGQSVDIDMRSISTFLRTAVENMLGFNAGNAYFSAGDLGDLGVPAYVAGGLACVPLALLFGWYAGDVVRRKASLAPAVLGVFLIVPLLLTSTVTVRQEFRWLYAPFAVVVIGLAGAAGRYGARSVPAGLAAWALTAAIGGAVYYRQFAPNIFFVHNMAVGASLRDELLRDPSQRIVLAVHRDRTFRGWAFQGDTFFRMYGLDGSRVRYVDEPAEATNEIGRVAVLSVEMTEAGVARVEMPRVTVTPFDGVRVSFQSDFEKGVISSKRPTRTPGGHGVFLFPYAGEHFGASSLTVLPTFRYTFRHVTIVPNEYLMFYIAQPLAAGGPSRAFVSIRDSRGPVEVFSAVVPPAVSEPEWRRQDVDLKRFAGRSVDVTFGADPTTADESAWVAFAEPSLVVASR